MRFSSAYESELMEWIYFPVSLLKHCSSCIKFQFVALMSLLQMLTKPAGKNFLAVAGVSGPCVAPGRSGLSTIP